MPEGDTVFRLAGRLRAALDGRTLVRGDLRVPQHATADLAGRSILGHDTHGKHLLTRLDGGLTLHTHLRMTGSWTITHPGRRLPRRLLPDARVLLETDEGRTAYGLSLPVVELLATRDEPTVVGHLGPDPLRPDWDLAAATARLRADPDRPVNAALLDQTCLAGLGNLWVNELCFLRGLHHWRPVRDVDVAALVRLAAHALTVSATRSGGFQVTTGNPRDPHWVTGRAHRPCRRCATPVQVRAEGPGGRRTWWCPSCQPG